MPGAARSKTRLWGIRTLGGIRSPDENSKLRLRMGRGAGPFPIDGPAVAECRYSYVGSGRWAADGMQEGRGSGLGPHEDAPPGHDCTCGIYAHNSIESCLPLRDNNKHLWRFSVLVWGWGKVMFGSSYWRAQYVQPAALIVRRGDYSDLKFPPRFQVNPQTTLDKFVRPMAETHGIPVLEGLEQVRMYTQVMKGTWVPEEEA